MTLFEHLPDNNNLILYLDLSTYCNAGCPQCDRTDIYGGGLDKKPWLENTMWDLEMIKNAYSDLTGIEKVILCGTWGDPMMVKEVDKIISYFRDRDLIVQINTNGGTRDVMWWYKLGKIMPSPNRITFDVDGVEEWMHQKYRRKVNLGKVLENLEAFTLGGGHAVAHCIVFEHNENHLIEIRDLCYSRGATHVTFQKSNRDFNKEGGKAFYFINEHGDRESLKRSTQLLQVESDEL